MVFNSLFNQNLMNKYIKKYKKEFKLTHSKKEAVLKWNKKLQNNELKVEVANYGLFSRLILETILGYDYEKDIKENVPEEHGRGFSEFALKKGDIKFMVIELKGQDNNLDKPQNRVNDKRTPVDQAFDYAKHSGAIDWIFVSNYKEFRLYNYHKRQHKYISFKAEDLQDPDNFKLFMLIFSKFSTIENNLIEKLVSKTHFVERDLEAEFYKLYNETRLMLIAELEHFHNEFTRHESVHYAQLILNRYIFICFAEDLGLLPEEISVESIENPVKNNNLGRNEIWHRLNGLFLDINEGNDFKKIYGYNGGLFSEDIESLKIRDIVEDHSIFKDAYQKWKFEEYSLIVEEKLSPYSREINPIYKNLMTISTFDFSSELDVNILGHIFENSIGEIEELKADTKGRRKKEGIFYTPEYITDYICRNTIIPYLSKSGNTNTVEKLIGEYWGSIDQLDEKVEKIKIVDPACGSGAFLNKASDILLEIHEAIHEYKYKDDKTLMPFFDNIEERRKILLNNIYGVDLNEESVEITKLSLFLKVCKKGLKLPNLDNNIRCGNSLIDDSEYTDKPFKWEEEFKEIFENGGFDIVIGNPPYIRQERIKELNSYFKENYNVFNGKADIYIYFFEKGIEIMKDGGLFSFICSNKFTKARYGQILRKLILENEFRKYIDHTYENIFEDATVHACTIVIKKGDLSKDNEILINEEFKIPQFQLNDATWSFKNAEIYDLRAKINDKCYQLNEIPNIDIYVGIKTGYNKAFIIDSKTKEMFIARDKQNKDLIEPLIRGKDIKKWKVDYNNLYLLNIPWKSNIENYPIIKEYLAKFKDKLESRPEVKSGRGDWFSLSRYGAGYQYEFKKEKIIWAEISPKPSFLIDKEKFYLLNTSYMIVSKNVNYNLRYLLSLLNSNVLFWVFQQISPQIEGKRLRYVKQYVEQLPIFPATIEQQKPFIKKADKILQLNKDLICEINGFKDWLKRTYKIEKFSQKVEKYYELSFDDFLTELKKKKVDTKPRKTQELLKKEFEESLNKINPLLQEIEKTDNEIDQMVYELYGLSEDEIKIIEDSLN